MSCVMTDVFDEVDIDNKQTTKRVSNRDYCFPINCCNKKAPVHFSDPYDVW